MNFGLLRREGFRKIPRPDPRVVSFGGKRIPVCEPTLLGHEKRYVSECLRKNWISSYGDFIPRFERAFARKVGARFGVACSSGTAALHMALASLHLKAGDEVILPTFTMIATVNAVTYVGARPVLVDADPATWSMDVSQIEKKITRRTRVVLPVHIYGHPVDMNPLLDLAKNRRLIVVEDAAEAHGARYKGRIVGNLGDLGAFSFYANKIIATGEGGMVVTDSAKAAEFCRRFRSHAFSSQGIHFWHSFVGYGCRMTNLQAAIGLAQLERFEELVQARRRHAHLYTRTLHKVMGIRTPSEAPYAKNVFWMYGILVEKPYPLTRDQLRLRLARHGIETRSFFIPVHWQPPFQKLFRGERYPVAEDLCAKGLYLPSSSSLTERQIRFISDVIAHPRG